jgi:hypothetical protein
MLSSSFSRLLRSQRSSLRSISSFIQSFNDTTAKLPYRDIIRYSERNVKVSSEELRADLDQIADAFLDLGLQKGDVIASWVPDGEIKHKLQLLCAKMGYVFADWDRTMDSVDEVREALSLSQPTMVVTDPTSNVDTVDCLKLLRIAVPELYQHVGGSSPFHSHQFPSLRYFVNTVNQPQKGFKRLITLKAFGSDGVRGVAEEKKVKDSDPLFVRITKNGPFAVSASKTLSHKQVWESGAWPRITKLVKAEYQEMWENEAVDYEKLKALTGLQFPDPRIVDMEEVIAAIRTEGVAPIPDDVQLTEQELQLGREIRSDLLGMLENFELCDGSRMFNVLAAKYPQLRNPQQAERLGLATMHPQLMTHA